VLRPRHFTCSDWQEIVVDVVGDHVDGAFVVVWGVGWAVVGDELIMLVGCPVVGEVEVGWAAVGDVELEWAVDGEPVTCAEVGWAVDGELVTCGVGGAEDGDGVVEATTEGDTVVGDEKRVGGEGGKVTNPKLHAVSLVEQR